MDKLIYFSDSGHPSLISDPLDGTKKIVPFGKPIDVMLGVEPQYQCCTVVTARIGSIFYRTSTGEIKEDVVDGILREMVTQKNMRLSHMFWSEGSKINVVFDLNPETGVIRPEIKNAADCNLIGYSLYVGMDDLNRRPR